MNSTVESGHTAPSPSRRRRLLRSPWFHLVAAFLVIALAQGLVIKAYQVPSGSMEPTLQVGDRLLVNRLAYAGDAAPEIGDVVVFARPDSWRDPRSPEPGALRKVAGWVGDIIGFGPSNTYALVKRVVAGPGQTLSCCSPDGEILLDDAPLPSPPPPYDFPFRPGIQDCTTTPASQRCLSPYVVPQDSFVVLGDHRSNSGDSLAECRSILPGTPDGCVRLVPREDIIGKVFTVALPPSRWGQDLDLTEK